MMFRVTPYRSTKYVNVSYLQHFFHTLKHKSLSDLCKKKKLDVRSEEKSKLLVNIYEKRVKKKEKKRRKSK